jgi:type VI protein secretion system component VasK
VWTFLKALALLLIAVLAIAFAVANRQVVSVSFDPFSSGDPALVLTAPLFLLVFFLLTCGVVIGGAASWWGQGRYRKVAQRAPAEVREVRAENARLRTELDIQSRQNREAARLSGASSGRLPALELHDAH